MTATTRRTRLVTAKNLVDAAVARAAAAVALELEKVAHEQALREAGPILEEMRSKAEKLGPPGTPIVRWVDRTLRQLRKKARVQP